MRVVVRHALRNALIPVLTVQAMQFAALLGGALITEIIFAWPGIGRLAVQAIENRDFPLVQAVVLLAATVFVIVNLLVDLTYAALHIRGCSYEASLFELRTNVTLALLSGLDCDSVVTGDRVALRRMAAGRSVRVCREAPGRGDRRGMPGGDAIRQSCPRASIVRCGGDDPAL